ncbi:hypothetical protein ACHHYP_08157 [Achlya hypogyna]|uniref:Uncharacterized protein n=1 Tax=Achlya hypogyna TaxID=1202772 RepID=A0A1V9ZL70_ACHHY|nr:hypothetical protein ACHHYP_08157 [Achlya hypogyna]
MKPSILGGSPNLVAERKRREKAEAHAKKSRDDVVLLSASLLPQVQGLTAAVEALQHANEDQLQLEAASQETFLFLRQQLEALRASQHDAKLELHAQLDKKIDRIHYNIALEHKSIRRHLQDVKIEVDAMKEHMAVLRGEIDSFRNGAHSRLNQTQGLLNKLREQAQKESEATSTSLHSLASKFSALDEKLFALEKEQLKLKLALPPGFGLRGNDDLLSTGSATICLKQRLDDLQLELDAIKADTSAYRVGDRAQFDAITCRLRELARGAAASQDRVLADVEALHQKVLHITTKLPVDVAEQLEAAQKEWAADIAVLKHSTKTREVVTPPLTHDQDDLRDAVTELRAHVAATETKMNHVAAGLHALQVNSGTHVLQLQQRVQEVADSGAADKRDWATQLLTLQDLMQQLRQFVEPLNDAT